jgi:drug/metabolite transporter (DMT)-like permease
LLSILVWTVTYSLVTAFSITLLGDRNLISGDLYNVNNLLRLIIHWKFTLAFILAVAARATFVIINNLILQIPEYEQSATTITAFIASIAFIFVILVNFIFLNEKISLQQLTGAITIMLGIWLMMK